MCAEPKKTTRDPVHEEFVFPEEIIERLGIEKNRCAKTILQALELVYGKDNDKWSDIRRIVLRSINDYHRYVESTVEKVV